MNALRSDVNALYEDRGYIQKMHIKNNMLLSFLVTLLLLLVGCTETEMSDLVMRKGLAYKRGSGLYSGAVVSYFPQTAKEKENGVDRRIAKEGEFKNGRKEGDWTTYSWNGEYSVIPYENGKRHGLAKWFYTNEVVKREQWYGNNMRHGSGTYRNANGEITKQVFYNRDRLVNPVGARRAGIDKLSTEDVEEEGPGLVDTILKMVDEFF